MMELAGKSVYVLGMGLSGVSAALLCLERGARVTGLDQRARADLSDAAQRLPIEIRTGKAAAELLASLAGGGSGLIVVSPGVDQRHALDAAAAAGNEVIGELELGARLSEAPLCAVGGTNGKSTTTELIGAMLSQAGQSVFCGGNLGTPLTQAVGKAWDCLVVEVSSFQLERAPTVRPQVSLLLNITDDHLDRHGTFAAYAAAKGNAFVNQTPDDVAIALWGDAEVERQVKRGRGRVLYFGADGDYLVRDGGVFEVSSGESFPLQGTQLSGRHNQRNAAAAIAAARALGASRDAILRALLAYRPLPHRLAWVESIGGVAFYDDSKATNVGAAAAAIDSLSEAKVVLIAGGKGKEGSYAPLAQALAQRGRAVILIGEAAPLMAKALEHSAEVELASDLDVAVERAYRLARPGDAVLLAPACASFDMFQSYADRGERFVHAVKRLARAEGERLA
jgi:UDP-N-acetylmuramoylalanine--D-glutamate ligase